MHELSLALALVETLEERLRDRSGARVTAVHLRIGPLAGVVESALRAAFEVAAAGTLADGAHLAIERTSIVVRCRACGQERRIDGPSTDESNGFVAHLIHLPSTCASCGSGAPAVIGGDELELVAVEVVDA